MELGHVAGLQDGYLAKLEMGPDRPRRAAPEVLAASQLSLELEGGDLACLPPPPRKRSAPKPRGSGRTPRQTLYKWLGSLGVSLLVIETPQTKERTDALSPE